MNSRLSSIKRVLKIDLEDHPAAFVWGPRQVGKTTLLRQQFPSAKYYDLLDTDLMTALTLKPSRLREELLVEKAPLVIIDEIQKVPALLDEVHWLIENTKTQFILCGSSARKLKKGAANLLGGRAWRFELFPLTTHEVKIDDLEFVFNHGLVPSNFLAKKPERNLKSYLYDYLREEIQHEALVRNVPAFARFLDTVAATHGQLINYANIGSDAGVSPKTVREYFQILEDTLLGHTLEPWRKVKDRRLIETAKFYLFDMGVVRALRGFPLIQKGTSEFGNFFEHFLIEEVRAYLAYKEKNLPIAFWRTSNSLEVDLIVGDMDVAIEFKSTDNVVPKHVNGLRALIEEFKPKKPLLVCCEKTSRQRADGILVLPWQVFCKKLWTGEIC
ncbi:MAG: hypothetical protein ACD_62C00528G0003 [uncultured bacterium]|nr:MAG: hypothetical protein ACD_62C00528G0003 [uncultured bacterium]